MRIANVDVLILTALTEEQRVTRSVLSSLSRPAGEHGAIPTRVSLYQFMSRESETYLIATACAHDMGGVAMSTFTASLLDVGGIRPTCAILTGIAASIQPDLASPGDVAVASEVYAGDDVKVADGKIAFRPHGYQVDRQLRLAAGHVREDPERHTRWRTHCIETLKSIITDLNGCDRTQVVTPAAPLAPMLLVGPGSAGPFLIADREFAVALREGSPTVGPLHPKLVWAEMEAHGFMRACSEREVPASVIKGISDCGDSDKSVLERSLGGFYRAAACSNAVVAILEMLRERPPAWAMPAGLAPRSNRDRST